MKVLTMKSQEEKMSRLQVIWIKLKNFKSNWISPSRKSCSYWHSSDNISDLWSQQGLFRTTPGSQVGFIINHNVQSLHAQYQEMVVLCSMDPSLWPEHYRSFRIWNYCFLPAGWTAQTHRSSSNWLWWIFNILALRVTLNVGLISGCFLLVFYILVIFFVLEQRHKLTGVAVRPIPSISGLVNRF